MRACTPWLSSVMMAKQTLDMLFDGACCPQGCPNNICPKASNANSLKFVRFLGIFLWISLKIVMLAKQLLSGNYWYSVGNAHILESSSSNMSFLENAFQTKSRGVGDDFVWFFISRLPRQGVHTTAPRCENIDFGAFRCRGVEKMKKNRILAGEVLKK